MQDQEGGLGQRVDAQLGEPHQQAGGEDQHAGAGKLGGEVVQEVAAAEAARSTVARQAGLAGAWANMGKVRSCRS